MLVLRIVIAAAVLLALYVRFAPSDAGRFHVSGAVQSDADLEGGVKRILPGVTLAELDQIAQQTPRTKVLAGSVDDGMISYVTRSRLIGFPDYTTIEAKDGMVTVFARLRFGRSDLGVNRRRVEGWIKALGA
ncbi:MAG: DUF1499 domain-containing protein [Cognatishimia sp.]|uniref:DUF1499 domain-containing protein n=1 Tax=Cognatishimia sp. TaxID=2211648 RepID=UPI004058C04B